MSGMDIGKLRQIASTQQFLLLAILGQIGFFCCIQSLPALAPALGRAPDLLPALVGLLILGGLFLTAIFTLVSVVRLAWALDHNRILAVVISPLYCAPCLGLLLMAVLNARANKLFRQAGVPVGLLGVSKKSLDAYEAETMGEVFD